MIGRRKRQQILLNMKDKIYNPEDYEDEEYSDEETEREQKTKGGSLKEMLKIKPFEVSAKKIKSPPAMEAIEVKHPCSILCCGMTGSGKSVVVCSLLTNPNMFYKYFDEVYLFSATAKQDETFQHLGLPEENIITENMIERLEEIVEEQGHLVETHGLYDAPKICIIFEDLTAQKKLQRSKAFTESFVQNRHINSTTIACIHKYNGIERTARLNCNHTIIFPCTNTERDIIREEHMPPTMTKNQFNAMLVEAFRPDEDNDRPFLHINSKTTFDKKFRKNLTDILTPQ